MARRMIAAGLLAGTPALAQKLGQGGTGVDENTELPRCAAPLGVVALVEEKAPDMRDSLSPGLAALLKMAEAQQGGGTARVDPLPLIKLMAARSNCFRVADRGAAMSALERERAMAGATPSAAMTKADYLISAQVRSRPARPARRISASSVVVCCLGLAWARSAAPTGRPISERSPRWQSSTRSVSSSSTCKRACRLSPQL